MSKREKILQICRLAMKLNSEATHQKITGDKPTVFFYFSGHISMINVRIYTKGWKADNRPEIEYDLFLNGDEEPINECLGVLKSLWKIQIKEVQANAV